MPDRHIGARRELQAEQALCRIEGRLDHAVETEVGLDRRFFDVATPLAQLFRVVAPVPGRKFEIAAFLLHQRLQCVAIGFRAGARRRPHCVEQMTDRVRRFRHGVVEPVMGEVVIAEQAATLGAQLHHLGNNRLVVGCAAIVAAADEGAKDLFAQIAALRELQEWFDAGARQRDNAAVETALLRFRLHRFAHEIGQAGKLGFAFE